MRGFEEEPFNDVVPGFKAHPSAEAFWTRGLGSRVQGCFFCRYCLKTFIVWGFIKITALLYIRMPRLSFIHMCIYIYMCIYVCVYVYVYVDRQIS